MTEWATTVQLCVEICTLLRMYGVKDKNVSEAYRQLPGQTQLYPPHRSPSPWKGSVLTQRF